MVDSGGEIWYTYCICNDRNSIFSEVVLRNRQIVFFILISALLCLFVGAETVENSLANGVYTVQNVASGENLNAFDIQYAKNGNAYTDKASGEEGENMLILLQEDGTYLLYPQSEAGAYAFCASGVGKRVSKRKELTENSYFRIVPAEGGYIIQTADGNVLGVSGKDTLYKKQLVLTETAGDTDTQKWVFSPVSVSSLELKIVAPKVAVHSVSAVYALTKPSYMKKNVQWSCSDERILLLDDDGSFCALSEGRATVTATIDGLTESIEIEVVDADAFTYYSQHHTVGGKWNGEDLSKVYFYAGAYKRFLINGYNRGLDWMDEGCAITSVATVLHNLGARYADGYDFRFEADGDLEADPYTVALANSGNRGLVGEKGTLYYSPIMMNLRAITSKFTLYGQRLESKTVYGVTKAKLKAQLDAHPEGVIVAMKNSYNGSHYIVVTECINPDAKRANDYKFKIYDPSGLHRYDGEDVLFEKSISYVTMRYRYGHMIEMIVFDFVPEEG